MGQPARASQPASQLESCSCLPPPRQPQNPRNTHQDLQEQRAGCLRPTLMSLSTITLTRPRPCGLDTVGSSEQRQPRWAREEDRDKVDERREKQLEPGGATRGGQLEKLNLSRILSSNNTTS